jgi:hypothetical protein
MASGRYFREDQEKVFGTSQLRASGITEEAMIRNTLEVRIAFRDE